MTTPSATTPAQKFLLRRIHEIVGDSAEITNGASLNEYVVRVSQRQDVSEKIAGFERMAYDTTGLIVRVVLRVE